MEEISQLRNRVSRTAIAGFAALAITAAASGCGGAITVDGNVEGSAPLSEGLSALGGNGSSGECTESASGIATGDTVTISSGDQVMGTGALETGEFDGTGLTCIFPFTVSGVEPGHESYTLDVQSVQGEELYYSEEELREGAHMMLVGSFN